MEEGASAVVMYRHQPIPRDLGMGGAEGVVNAAGVTQYPALGSGVAAKKTEGAWRDAACAAGVAEPPDEAWKHGDVTVMAASPSPLARSRTPAVASIQKSSLRVRRKADGKGSDQSGAPPDDRYAYPSFRQAASARFTRLFAADSGTPVSR